MFAPHVTVAIMVLMHTSPLNHLSCSLIRLSRDSF